MHRRSPAVAPLYIGTAAPRTYCMNCNMRDNATIAHVYVSIGLLCTCTHMNLKYSDRTLDVLVQVHIADKVTRTAYHYLLHRRMPAAITFPVSCVRLSSLEVFRDRAARTVTSCLSHFVLLMSHISFSLFQIIFHTARMSIFVCIFCRSSCT